jgi:hypothetical protein
VSPFGLDGRSWEGEGAVPVAVNGGERREGAVGGSGRSSGVVVDGGGGEVAVTCHSVIITVGGVPAMRIPVNLARKG